MPKEIASGLLQVLIEEEAERNEILAKVDQLMRDLKNSRERLQQVREENAELARSLPGPGKTASDDVSLNRKP